MGRQPTLDASEDKSGRGEGKGRLEDEKDMEIKEIEPPLRPFFLHQWLDICDEEGTWLESQVIETRKDEKEVVTEVQIHYKGWKAKYDEWLTVTEGHAHLSRIATLHTHTKRHERKRVRFRLGLELDVQDTREVWCSGKVQTIEPIAGCTVTLVLISYNTWSSKYDEWIYSSSYRLAPLYTHTKPTAGAPGKPTTGYTATQDEESKFREALRRNGWEIKEQGGDGNCLFRSVSHQVYGSPDHHAIVRQKCIEYIESEKAFYSSYISGDFDEYVRTMKQVGAWGDHVEIQAMSEIYDRPIEVYAYSDKPLNTYQGAPTINLPMRLSYHYQSHYNSIVDEKLWSRTILTVPPGSIEDVQISESKKRGGKRLGLASGKPDEEMKAALELSRQEFLARSAGDIDRAIHASVHDEKMTDWDRAVMSSVRTDRKHASPEAAGAGAGFGGAAAAGAAGMGLPLLGVRSIEEEQVARALELSRVAAGPGGELQAALEASRREAEAEEARVLRASQASAPIDPELALALEMSMQDDESSAIMASLQDRSGRP